MQKSKIHIWLIGVTLAVAPIFYATLAQAQSSQQAGSVQELQQLRAEIAELRDMIERQQFQIRQLQRQAGATAGATTGATTSPTAASSPVGSGPQSVTVAQPGLNTTAGTVPGITGPDFVGSEAVPSAGPATSSSQAGQQASTSVIDASTTPTVPQSEEEFYRPYAGEETINANPEVVSAARQARQASDTYPPVVDRSIQAAGNSAPVTQAPVGVTNVPVGAAAGTAATASTVVGSAPNPGGVTVQTPGQGQPASQDPTVTTSPGVLDQNGRIIDPTQTVGSEQAVVANSVPTQSPQGGGVIQIPNNGNVSSTPNAAQTTASQATTAAAAPVPQPVVLAEDVLYQQGFDLLKQFKYDDAVAVFQQQLEQYPSGSYADDALYWIAESMYLNRNLGESKKYFRNIIDNFAQSPRVPDAMLKTAYIEQDQGNEIEARILLQEIIQYHPRSDAAISAKNRLEKLQ